MKIWVLPLLMISAQLWAQNPEAEGSYEERPGISTYVELGITPSNAIVDQKIMKKPFDVTFKTSGIYGAGAHLPLNNWLGLNGFVGVQQVTFDYKMRGNAALQQMVLDSIVSLSEDDLDGQLISRNLLIQAGAEAGLPIYTNYKNQLMIKGLGFAGGIVGKTFFDESKYDNTEIFGYAYGASVRLAWGQFGLESGLRSSHIWWRAFFDPAEKTGEQILDDVFMVDYDSYFSPFVKIIWSLY